MGAGSLVAVGLTAEAVFWVLVLLFGNEVAMNLLNRIDKGIVLAVVAGAVLGVIAFGVLMRWLGI